MAEFQYYKGYPLVKTEPNKIYYGDMSKNCVCEINIVSTKNENGVEIADKLTMFLMRTVEGLSPFQSVIRRMNPTSLYDALETANSLLDKYNS